MPDAEGQSSFDSSEGMVVLVSVMEVEETALDL